MSEVAKEAVESAAEVVSVGLNKNPIALISLVIIVMIFICVILYAWKNLDTSSSINEQNRLVKEQNDLLRTIADQQKMLVDQQKEFIIEVRYCSRIKTNQR